MHCNKTSNAVIHAGCPLRSQLSQVFIQTVGIMSGLLPTLFCDLWRLFLIKSLRKYDHQAEFNRENCWTASRSTPRGEKNVREVKGDEEKQADERTDKDVQGLSVTFTKSSRSDTDHSTVCHPSSAALSLSSPSWIPPLFTFFPPLALFLSALSPSLSLSFLSFHSSLHRSSSFPRSSKSLPLSLSHTTVHPDPLETHNTLSLSPSDRPLRHINTHSHT